MGLKEQLKMREFKSEYQKAHLNLYHTVYGMLYREKQFFSNYDLTSNQYNVLRILRGQNGKSVSIKEIRSRMLDRGSDVGRIVVRLEKKGLVKKMICENDRRAMDVVISEKGLALLTDINDAPSEEALNSGMLNLTEEQARQLNELLDIIRG